MDKKKPLDEVNLIDLLAANKRLRHLLYEVGIVSDNGAKIAKSKYNIDSNVVWKNVTREAKKDC